MSYTYAILEVSASTYRDIKALLLKAGHQEAFHDEEDGVLIDMHGIALKEVKVSESANSRRSCARIAGRNFRPLLE